MTTNSVNQASRWNLLYHLKMGNKIDIGFGVLVVLTLLVSGLNYISSTRATQRINSIEQVQAPAALITSRAQANLLRILDDVYIYLALGDSRYRDRYDQHNAAFHADLLSLELLSANMNLSDANMTRREQLRSTFTEWSPLPEELFALRDNQLEREPAYKILATDGLRIGGNILIDINSLIDRQGQRTPTGDSISLMREMARFEGSFAAMLSGLRSYVTTRNRSFRSEYEANLDLNRFSWNQLTSQRAQLDPEQKRTLDKIAVEREAFLQLPIQMFTVLESDQWRQDLFLFKTKAVPLANTMLDLLDKITTDQHYQLRSELTAGRAGLEIANQQTLAGVSFSLVLAVVMAYIFRQNIARPIRRLTGIAKQIQAGDLSARAPIESGDEIGTLSKTFNGMTGQLQQMLEHVRTEKQRADDLLEVVIPIGVALSSEKNFNRMLENILVEAKMFCNADAGTLYLRTQDNQLKFEIIHNDSFQLWLGGTSGKEVPFPPLPMYDQVTGEPHIRNVAVHAAITEQSINIPDTHQSTDFDFDFDGFDVYDENSKSYPRSFLTIPLKNSANKVLGVLQLLNAKNPATGEAIPFDANIQQMMESLSLLAVAALEAYIREQGLRREIQKLRIEIDQVKRQKQVSEIIETDFFTSLKTKAQYLRASQRNYAHDLLDGTAPPEMAGDETPAHDANNSAVPLAHDGNTSDMVDPA